MVGFIQASSEFETNEMVRKEVTENKLLKEVARPKRFELPTLRFESSKKTL